MIKLLTSGWMTAIISSLLFLGTTLALWKTPAIPVKRLAMVAPAANQTGASWDFVNPEADQLMAELRDEKKAYDKKEQDLNDLSTRLEAERLELNGVTQSVHQLQVDFDKNVLRITEEETVNLKKLAKVYSAMDPENAANIFEEMDDVAIIKIMVFMKDSETALIWEAMAKKGQPEAKRTADLSERLRLTSLPNTPAK